MNDFDSPSKYVKAARLHRCIYCGESILIGEHHFVITGRYDESWYRNRWHEECWHDTIYEGDEFIPYSQERPSFKVVIDPNSK